MIFTLVATHDWVMAIVTSPFCFSSQILRYVKYNEKQLFVVVKYFGIQISGLEKYGKKDNKDFLEEHSLELNIKRGLNAKKKRCFSFNIETLPEDCKIQIKEMFSCI